MSNPKYPPERLKGLRPAKKGEVRNPNGKNGPTGLPAEVRLERRQNLIGLIRLVSRYMTMTNEQCQQHLASPGATRLEEIINGTINRAAEGDVNCFKYLMEIIAGKPPETDDEPFSEEDLRILKRIQDLRLIKEATEVDVKDVE